MATPSEPFLEAKSFFHALSKVNTEIAQYVYESAYKSAHTVRSDDIWSDPISYCVDAAAADAWVTANPSIGNKYTSELLTEVPGSNGQAWKFQDGLQFVDKWIAPTDVPHSVSKDPSYGFQMTLYQNDGTTIIPPATGVWVVDYYAGLVLFQQGATPSSAPRVTFYNYIGATGGGGGSASGIFPIIHTAVSITLDTTHYTVLFDTVSGNYLQCWLPDATLHTDRIYEIKNTGPGFVSINASLVQLIDMVSDTYTLMSQNEAIRLQSDGVSWYILG